MNENDQDAWTLSMTFQWLEEAAEFLNKMGVLQTESIEHVVTPLAAEPSEAT